MRRRRNVPIQRCPPPATPLSDSRATVLGLGGVGRQVAVQLAALGVGRLQLVDRRIVGVRTHAAEGFAAEDVGRPRVHATAQACHQINPQLDIQTAQRSSLQSLDPGDAVYCCDLSTRRRRSIWRAVRDRVPFFASVDLHDDRIYLPVVVAGAAAGDELTGVELLPPWGETVGQRRSACPGHVASIVAGLMVSAFVRFAAGRGTNREIHLNLRDLDLIVTGLA